MGFSTETNNLQFYPTPDWLAKKVWEKFQSRDFVRVLDACAGTGALALAAPFRQTERYSYYYRDHTPIDCVEIDLTKHPILREHGLNIVGLDFLSFEGGVGFSHVVLNPPFSQGHKHVLKAYDMLWEGEVSAIINALEIRSPKSREQERLVRLVEEYGSCEFIEGAFKGTGVDREADVEVALVHLIKKPECNEDWIGPIIESMQADAEQSKPQSWELPRELALPESFVERQVRSFRMAVKAMREAVRIEAVAEHYAARIGDTMEVNAKNSGVAPRGKVSETDIAPHVGAEVRKKLTSRYTALKDRAWTSVLRSTDALNRLSSKVQKQAEARFEEIKLLDFTEANVWGFLLGLVESQPEMLIDAACDVFDLITRYTYDNSVFYKGWKSNDAHLTCGRRIKTTRFIIPGHGRDSFHSSLSWDSERMLADFDKVFAFADGKTEPEVSLVSVFRGKLAELRAGGRVTSSYFDVRWHPGVGTIHFFPRDKKLIDRFNRIVGAKRQWLPPQGASVPREFWLQYEKAEKFDSELRQEVTKARREAVGGSYRSRHDDPFRAVSRAGDGAQLDGEDQRAVRLVENALINVLDRHGLRAALTHESPATGDGGGVLLLPSNIGSEQTDLRRAA